MTVVGGGGWWPTAADHGGQWRRKVADVVIQWSMTVYRRIVVVLGRDGIISIQSHTPPYWLQSLLSEKFFNACMIHEDAKKNEKNIFCLDCCEAICHHCLDLHTSHRLLQIRRYVYHDVIRVGDAEKLMDCSYVQAYTTNSAKVVFLNPRPQTRACRSSSNNCVSCDRGLQDSYFFCSISCKISQILRSEGMLSEYLHDCEVLTLPEMGSDDGLMTPESVLEPFVSLRTSSGSSASCAGVDRLTIACTATTEIVRKKRTSKSAIPPASRKPVNPSAVETPANRRKGMPRRSPFN
ncbi:uncharacterized protein LOC112529080 [Cynara cardunculus var. scolymus]|uniref:uncharacterized protein LOC112529080 n=1 Tax=Cynara cardunculus var. scolymus TaxID=59895 RepID=UPI000D62F00A|nr:uncharacterized protein LOC112529080 [Cynara cardunculus var. scolymus]